MLGKHNRHFWSLLTSLAGSLVFVAQIPRRQLANFWTHHMALIQDPPALTSCPILSQATGAAHNTCHWPQGCNRLFLSSADPMQVMIGRVLAHSVSVHTKPCSGMRPY